MIKKMQTNIQLEKKIVELYLQNIPYCSNICCQIVKKLENLEPDLHRKVWNQLLYLNGKVVKQLWKYLKNKIIVLDQNIPQIKKLWSDDLDIHKIKRSMIQIPSELIKKQKQYLINTYCYFVHYSIFNQSLSKVKFQQAQQLYHVIGNMLNQSIPPKLQINTKSCLNENIKTNQVFCQEQKWNNTEQIYLCQVYQQYSVTKCCQLLYQKYGYSLKWDTTRKIVKKIQKMINLSLKKLKNASLIYSPNSTLARLKDHKFSIITHKMTQTVQTTLLKYYFHDPKDENAIDQMIKMITEVINFTYHHKYQRCAKTTFEESQCSVQWNNAKSEAKEIKLLKILTKTENETKKQFNLAKLQNKPKFHMID